MSNDGEMKVVQIPMDEIFADQELNCRGHIVPYDVIELAKSIDNAGLQQPITVQPYNKVPGKKYRIVIGHRRHRAFEVLERKTIPAIIKEGLSEVQTRILNLRENLDRKDLNIMQEALAIKKFKDAGYIQDEVAQMIGVSKGWVQVRFSLLEMESEIQEAAAAGFVTQEQIKDLYSLPSREQRFEAVKNIKESRIRGEKRAIKIKKPKKNPLAKRPRKREEIFEMMDHIMDSVGANFGTRTLAWAAGEISDIEIYRDIRDLAKGAGKDYEVPIETMSTM